jgi:hypothetical protein
MKKNVKNRKGVATIIGSILSIVILIFFFSNVFLWYNGVSRQMNLVTADKLNAQVNLATTVFEENYTHCTDDPWFGGIEDKQLGEYGVIQEGSFLDTYNEPDDTPQILREESHYITQFYIALNATYSFTVDVQEVPKSRSLTFSFYGWYDDDPDEACRVYLWNYDQEIYEYTGITITSIESWYNATFLNPKRFVSSSGAVNVTYLSTHNLYDQSVSPESKGRLHIDAHHVTLSTVGLTVRALGGRDIQLLRLWIINETANEHHYIDFNDVLGLEIWVPGGSSIDIEFGDMDQIIDGNIMLDYSPILGEVRFRILTNLGNTAMTKYE